MIKKINSRRPLHSRNSMSGSPSPLTNASNEGTRRKSFEEDGDTSGDDIENKEFERDPTDTDSSESDTNDKTHNHSNQILQKPTSKQHIQFKPEYSAPPSSSKHHFQYKPECAPSSSSKRHIQYKPECSAPSSSRFLQYGIYLIGILLAFVAFLYLSKRNASQVKSCTFEKLKQRAPLQSPEVWAALQVNIELLLNEKSSSPNVYLFLHTNESSKSEMQELVKDIALETSKCFDGQQPIEMSSKDFEGQAGDDYGYPIEQYKKKIKEGNVFLIVDLNAIPPRTARALHTICDTYSPIAPGVVIFLTLRTQLATDANPAQLANQALQILWKEIPDNELHPLITRVIDQVLLLKS